MRYKYILDERCKRLTIIFAVIIVGLGLVAYFFSPGNYLSAWYIAFALAILALLVLSIPRFIKIDGNSLEIHCIVELTQIKMEDIKSVRKIDRGRMKYCFPLLGSYGFFGYYGYYFNLSEMNLVKVYASKWDDFVMIEDIYDNIYIVNCDRSDELVRLVNRARFGKLMEN